MVPVRSVLARRLVGFVVLASDDEYVERFDLVAVYPERVDLERAQSIAKRQGSVGDPHDNVGEPVEIGRLATAGAAQERGAAQLADHLDDVCLADRQRPQADVPEHFHEDAANANRYHGPECRIHAYPGEQLDASG